MSLRPRYSLLTLLLLTAVIAVGIKLWRGPHELLVFDPASDTYPENAPSASDVKLLKMMPVRPYVCGGSSASHRYIYKNTFQGPEVVLVAGQPTEAHVIIYNAYPKPNEGSIWIFPKKYEQAPTTEGALPLIEIHGWVQGEPGNNSKQGHWLSMSHGNFMLSAPSPRFVRERSHLYLLTKKRQVFQVVSNQILRVDLKLVEVDSIPNLDVREWIQLEFAKL